MKVVFILNNNHKLRYFKRIEEFIARDYEIEVFAFSRKEGNGRDLRLPINILGEFENGHSYLYRLGTLYRGIKTLLRKHKKQQVLYYIFGLDVAVMFYILRQGENYIYEEGDLVHTYMKNGQIRSLLEFIDKKILVNAVMAIYTSEGFPSYHFGQNPQGNFFIIPNKLDSRIKKVKNVSIDTKFDPAHISFGFVGAPRFDNIFYFFDCACQNFPEHEFHIFGAPIPPKFEKLNNYTNITLHGPFVSPDDLPEIYKKIDIVISTYDTDSDNVRYAEPNKLYEAIYFNTPIVVSENTFLSQKVNRMGIGFSIKVTEQGVVDFIKSLTKENYEIKIHKIETFDKEDMINNNNSFFQKFDEILCKLING